MKRLLISFMALVMMLIMCVGLVQPVFADVSSPVAENLELKTYRGVSVGGCLTAYDPDGDDVSFMITTEPIKGKIQLEKSGSFVYTPLENKKGRDYFGYKAVDSKGNCSQEATVIIRIDKQKKDVMYSDMQGSKDEYAAIALSEMGIYTGSQIGANFCFYPKSTVSRGEFLSMCMLISDEPIFTGVLSTGYSDDAAIPKWMKSYVATAAMCGIAGGYAAEDGTVFDVDAPITYKDAALMLDRALNVTKVSYLPLDEELDLDCAQACVNLSACGVIKDGTPVSSLLTRAEAAQMLVNAVELKNNR